MIVSMPFADPPFAVRYTVEEPMALLVLLLIVGSVLMTVAHQHRKRRMAASGVVAWALAACLWLIATVVTSDRQRLVHQSHVLLTATTPMDLLTMRKILHEGAFFSGPLGTHWFDRDRTLSKLDGAIKQYGVSAHTYIDVQAQTDGNRRGKTILTLKTRINRRYMDRPVRTKWDIRWQLGDDNQWRIMEVRFLEYLLGKKPTRNLF